jgi:hypothetical protein
LSSRLRSFLKKSQCFISVVLIVFFIKKSICHRYKTTNQIILFWFINLNQNHVIWLLFNLVLVADERQCH